MSDAPDPAREAGTAPPPEAGARPKAESALSAMMGVRMDVQVVLGEARMPLAEIMRLGPGAVIGLDRRIGDPVDVLVGESLVARGDLVRAEDGRVGVSLTHVLLDPRAAVEG